MRTIKLTISYDGSGYSGWQIQPNGVTVQGLLQDAIRAMTGEENTLVGAGRTDAGVHAFAQAASFKTEKDISLYGFKSGLNSSLPKDIRIVEAEDVAESFHPIRDSKSKHYRYVILNAEHEHPLELNRAWLVRRELDLEAMKLAAEYLLGEHDFSAFAASDGCDSNVEKQISFVNLNEQLVFAGGWRGGVLRGRSNCTARRGSAATGPASKQTCYSLDIIGSGYLKNMVRNIVGTLVDVGLGKITPEDFKNILESKDRKKAGVCAPASGLYLIKVEY